MRALVAIKRVLDYNVKARVRADKMCVDLSGVKMSINPFCEIAVEEAVLLKQAGKVKEVVAVTVGPPSLKPQDVLRTAMGMGADRAIHVVTSEDLPADRDLQPLAVAQILNKVVEKEQPDLVFLGKQAIDSDDNATGQMLSQLTGFPSATFASEVTVNEDEVQVTREVDGGLQTLSLQTPAIVTADLRLNEPRFVKLPAIMKARKKPIEEYSPSDLGLEEAELTPLVTTVRVDDPPARQGGAIVADVDELIDKLRNEAKCL
ncbi:MAG: hypothetical protein MHM6MM_001638 [Cercozoa sp. M6MM]